MSLVQSHTPVSGMASKSHREPLHHVAALLQLMGRETFLLFPRNFILLPLSLVSMAESVISH